MFYLVPLLIVFITSYVTCRYLTTRNTTIHNVAKSVRFVSGLFLWVFLMAIPLIRYFIKEQMRDHQLYQVFVNEVRVSYKHPYELAGLSINIIEHNMWLTDTQYLNTLIYMDSFVPDEINNLEPIR